MDSRKNGTNILTTDEAKIVEAIADRIFPPTDTPGAVEIGAVRYIEIALNGDYAPLVPLYRQGLRSLNRLAREKFKRPFCFLTDEQKDTLLAAFETGAVPGFKLAAEFFETVRYHVLEGIFCEPQYGGNRDMMGWHLVGFPGQQFGYGNPYINKRVDLAPVRVDDPKAEEK
jgi:gluconate 2-dehydrogenase subunit 3-like protein